MSDLSKTFNWHEEWEKHTFYDWLLPTVMVGVDEKGWEAIKVASTPSTPDGKPHQAVVLQIFLNGVEVNAEHFIEGIDQNMKQLAERKAVELLKESTSFDGIMMAMEEAQRHVLDELRKAGVALQEEDYYR